MKQKTWAFADSKVDGRFEKKNMEFQGLFKKKISQVWNKRIQFFDPVKICRFISRFKLKDFSLLSIKSTFAYINKWVRLLSHANTDWFRYQMQKNYVDEHKMALKSTHLTKTFRFYCHCWVACGSLCLQLNVMRTRWYITDFPHSFKWLKIIEKKIIETPAEW